jgi:hypothetical protein
MIGFKSSDCQARRVAVQGQAQKDVFLVFQSSQRYWLAGLFLGGVSPPETLIVVPYKAQIALYNDRLKKFPEWTKSRVEEKLVAAASKVRFLRVIYFNEVQHSSRLIVLMDITVTDHGIS